MILILDLNTRVIPRVDIYSKYYHEKGTIKGVDKTGVLTIYYVEFDNDEEIHMFKYLMARENNVILRKPLLVPFFEEGLIEQYNYIK